MVWTNHYKTFINYKTYILHEIFNNCDLTQAFNELTNTSVKRKQDIVSHNSSNNIKTTKNIRHCQHTQKSLTNSIFVLIKHDREIE